MALSKGLRRMLGRSKSSVANFEEIIGEDFRWKEALSYAEVPGPKSLPILGNTWRFVPYIGPYQIRHLDKVSTNLYRRYGSVVKVDGLFGRPDMLFVFDPNEIENVFRQEDGMPYRPSMPSLNYYKHVYKKEFFGDEAGVIAVHGEHWQTFRSKVNKIMLQPKIAKMYIKPIESAAKEFVYRIKTIRNQNDEVGEDFLNELHKWSLESIAKVALDVRLGCLEEASHPDTQRLIDAVNTFFLNVPVLELRAPFWRLLSDPMKFPTFRKYILALETIREICSKHVNGALNNLDGRDKNKEPSVLQRLLELDGDTKTACILALDMFLVGIDTTSNAVASILYQLAINPDKQQNLHEEISTILPNFNTPMDERLLEQMSYLKSCIKETLRKYPVVIGNGRTTTKDCVIGGYHIPKGVQVIFQHCVISNSDTYFPNSSDFLPERWMKSCPYGDSDIAKNHHPFASLPFGYGRRMCLGRRFADLEIQTIIAKIVQSYKVEYNYKRLDYHVHPMYTPNGPLKFKFIERKTIEEF